MKGKAFSFFAVFFTALLFFPSPSACKEINRCLKYRSLVVREARYRLGLNAPSHYFLGQIEQESRCNSAIKAFDGGMGLGQFMPETAEWIQKREKDLQSISARPVPYDPRWSIRALIIYDNWLFKNAACNTWHYAFRAYNGGLGNLNREIRAAGSCDRRAVEKACRRKTLKLKQGCLDLCRVNIAYPQRILARAAKYERAMK